MNEPLGPTPPKRPVQPLPRLWKAGPQSSDAPPTSPKGNVPKPGGTEPPAVGSKAKEAKKKPRPTSSDAQGKPKGRRTILREETPELDTIEARQRVRVVLGAGLVGVLVLGGALIYQAILAEPSDEEGPIDFGPAASAPGPASRDRLEKEAGVLLDRARQMAKNGNAPLAVTSLERLIKSYPGTAAAAEAKLALSRPGENLPLFLDRPTVLASDSPSVAKASDAPTEVVVASGGSVAPSKGAEAGLQLPANPVEPFAALPGRSGGAAEVSARPLPKGFRADPNAGTHESGWPLVAVSDRDGAPMVLVPGGIFVRGRDGADVSEAPSHSVNLSTFYVDQHEVTVRQFKLFEREVGKRTDRVRALARDEALATIDDDPDRPVVMVSANDANDYAWWAGKRLPTEAQWEAAARTTDGRPFPWGTDAEPLKGREIRPVMTFPKDLSPYGAFDLGGNAWEWTKDWYEARAYAAFKFGRAENPTGPSARPRSGQLVIKGSSRGWESSGREGLKFDARLPYLGFRCVLSVEGPGNAFEPPPVTRERQPSSPSVGGTAVPF